MLLRARMNDASRSVMLAHARDSDLDRKVLLGHTNNDITTHYPAVEIQELIDASNKYWKRKTTHRH